MSAEMKMTIFALAQMRVLAIPKGLSPPAPGWQVREPTRGPSPNEIINRNAIAAFPLSGHGRRWPQPRCGWEWLGTVTQGGSFLATLGFETESRWDSWPAHPSVEP